MNIPLSGKQPTFRRQNSGTNSIRVLVLLILVVLSFFVLRGLETKQIVSPLAATPYPTRVASSFSLEGETRFIAGDLNGAIKAYQEATRLDPTNAQLYSELARIQTYSSALMTTDDERRARLQEALASINAAAKLAPEDSTVAAIRAFVLDWNANPSIAGEKAGATLTSAEQEAVRALQLDNQNTLALAYYSEILIDQQKIGQANQYIKQAIQSDPSLMDVHRINAVVQETLGNYGEAIREYQEAAKVTPNLTFLYLAIGINYRQLKQYDRALEYFDKAARINEQIQVKDPLPYLAIGKTYTQMGEFFVAANNVRKALRFNPYSADVYGQLGVVYFKSRNYEGAIESLACAVEGCDAATTCSVRRCDDTVDTAIVIDGLPLSQNTVVYYYTYASALAGMARPYNDYCTRAGKVLGQIRAEFSGDINVMSIVRANEDICASIGSSSKPMVSPTAGTPGVSVTRTPTALPTATPTPKPTVGY